MKREILTKKIVRIIETIESGNTPMPIRKLWIFGSYARGALECGDLDIALVVNQPNQEWLSDHVGPGWIWEQYNRFERHVKNSIKKRGERIDIIIMTKEESVIEFFNSVPVKDAILIWSEKDPDWQTKLYSIQPDPKASRFKRPYPIDLKRTGTSRDTMEKFVWLVDHNFLKMETINIDLIRPKISDHYRRYLDHISKMRGKASIKVIPYGLDWLRKEKKRVPRYLHSNTEIKSITGSHFVHIGKIEFGYALGWLYSYKKARKLCLIPHLRKRSKNEMFVIERGLNWTGNCLDDLKSSNLL